VRENTGRLYRLSEIDTKWLCMKLMGQIFLTFGTEVKTSEQSNGHLVISMLLVCVCVCVCVCV